MAKKKKPLTLGGAFPFWGDNEEGEGLEKRTVNSGPKCKRRSLLLTEGWQKTLENEG
jgi:hypothetical protein